MTRPFDLIVFDWDGTLMDSAARIVDSLQAASNELELASRTDQECRNIIGLGLNEAINMLYPEIDNEMRARFTDRFRHSFLVASPQPETLFAGVHEILQSLVQRQLWLGIATGKSRKGLDRALKETDCGAYFHVTRCADETCSKPNPMMLSEIIEELDVRAEKTLMIGDTGYDLDMAQRAGVAAVAVSYGAHEIEQLKLYQPLACLTSITELDHWLAANI